MLRALADHDVDCVVIGGFAAVMHGSPLLTQDIDITPRRDGENLTRLSDALYALDARVRIESVPEGRVWNLTTPYGDLDISFEPTGTQGYADLRRDAVLITLRGIPLQLASLADIVRSKAAADRPKDRRALPVLRELLARQHQQT